MLSLPSVQNTRLTSNHVWPTHTQTRTLSHTHIHTHIHAYIKNQRILLLPIFSLWHKLNAKANHYQRVRGCECACVCARQGWNYLYRNRESWRVRASERGSANLCMIHETQQKRGQRRRQRSRQRTPFALSIFVFCPMGKAQKHTHTRTLANDKAELSIVLIGICIALSAV